MVSFKIIKRAEKSVMIESGKRCKIHFDRDGNEFIFPEGRHSMCLVLRAEYEVISKSIERFAIEYEIEPTEKAIKNFFIKAGKLAQPYQNLLVRFSDDRVIYRDFC